MPRKFSAGPVIAPARRQSAPAPIAIPADPRLTGARDVLRKQLIADPTQPRRVFAQEALDELAASIRAHHVVQALLVRVDGVTDDGRLTRYAIIDGERRWRAAELAGEERLPVIVRDEADAQDLRTLQLIANMQREALDPMEEAVAFRDLMESQTPHLSTRDIGELIGRSHMYVQRRIHLLFDERLADAVRAGRLNATTASEVKSLPPEQRDEVIARISDGSVFDVPAIRAMKRAARQPKSDETPEQPVTLRYTNAPEVTPVTTVSAAATVTTTPSPDLGPEPEPRPTRADVVTQRYSSVGGAAPENGGGSSPVRVATADGLKAALGALDVAAAVELARFGAAEGWSCAQLVVALEAVGERPE